MIFTGTKNKDFSRIGIDIGSDSIKMIQIGRDNDKNYVLAAGKTFIPKDICDDSCKLEKFTVSAIKEMRCEGGFYGKSVVSAVPSDKLKITSFRVSESESLEQALKRNAETRFGLDTKKDIVSILSAGVVRNGKELKKELIMLGADRQTIADHINTLEHAGLKPSSIDTVPSALFRSLSKSLRRQEDVRKTMVFIDVGKKFTTIVFSCNGKVNFIKQVPIGGQKFDREIADKLAVNLDEAGILRGSFLLCRSKETNGDKNDNILESSTREAIKDAVSTVAKKLAREISLCLRYHSVAFRGKNIERALFSGGEAYNKILLDIFKQKITKDVEVGYPLRGVDIENVNLKSDKRNSLCEWTVATGLALK
jgi:type IV pilus assembly protein PilM